MNPSFYSTRVALITGAASGIGLALAQVLLERGATVLLTDIDPVRLQGQVEQLASPNAHQAVLDVIDPTQVEAVFEGARARFGRLNFVFNNAGIGGTLPFKEATRAHWERLLELNLWGVIYGTQTAYRILCEQGFGHIINTASISGLVPIPGQTLYNASKYAVVGLSETLRFEAARAGVRVSVVCPGLVRTGIFGVPILGERDPNALAPAGALDARAAAKYILHGVERNRGRIVLGPREVWLERLSRWFPGWMERELCQLERQRHP